MFGNGSQKSLLMRNGEFSNTSMMATVGTAYKFGGDAGTSFKAAGGKAGRH
jgi:hypothetical protein